MIIYIWLLSTHWALIDLNPMLLLVQSLLVNSIPICLILRHLVKYLWVLLYCKILGVLMVRARIILWLRIAYILTKKLIWKVVVCDWLMMVHDMRMNHGHLLIAICLLKVLSRIFVIRLIVTLVNKIMLVLRSFLHFVMKLLILNYQVLLILFWIKFI